MADGRIKQIEASQDITGGSGLFNWIVKWYYLTQPGSIKVFEILGMNYSEFEDELAAMALAEGVTFV